MTENSAQGVDQSLSAESRQAIWGFLLHKYGFDQNLIDWARQNANIAGDSKGAAAEFAKALKKAGTDDRAKPLESTLRMFRDPSTATSAGRVVRATADSVRTRRGTVDASRLESLVAIESSEDDVCQFIDVTVGGIPAVYIYSAFTTTAPFEGLLGWLDPQQWHQRGPQLWDEVKVIEGPAKNRIGDFDVEREIIWEVASPRWEVTRNYLTCDRAKYDRGRDFAVLSYDLAPDKPRDVLVDHGYVAIAEAGPGRYAAQFVKIIGFKDPEDNETVKRLRPIWISLLRTVAEWNGGAPAEFSPAEGDQPVNGAAEFNVGTVSQQWIDAAGSVVTEYGNLVSGFLQRFAGPSLGWDQFRDLVSTYWEGVLDKYADAWNTTQNVLSQAGRPSDRPTSALGFSRGKGRSAATSWVPAPGDGGSVVVSDLVSIVRDTSASIARSRVRTEFHESGSDRVLELAADTTGLPRGVYVGTADITTKMKVTTVPTYLFVSGAVPA